MGISFQRHDTQDDRRMGGLSRHRKVNVLWVQLAAYHAIDTPLEASVTGVCEGSESL